MDPDGLGRLGDVFFRCEKKKGVNHEQIWGQKIGTETLSDLEAFTIYDYCESLMSIKGLP